MAWRFKASKYKNAVGNPARRTEWVQDIDVGEVKTAAHPTIASSAAYVVFSQEGRGSGCCGIIDSSFFLERELTSGTDRPASPIPIDVFHPHGAQSVTCLEFSPFDDGLLATGSDDTTVKLWHLKDGRDSAECLFMPSPTNRVEALRFHPTCDFLLSCSAGDRIQLFDLIAQKDVLEMQTGFSGPVASMSWRQDGSELVAVDQLSRLVVLDPRKRGVSAHDTCLVPNKEAHVVCLADASNTVLITGFDNTRQRVACIYDVRNMKTSPGSLDFGTGVGSLVPLFDPDTGMVFLSARGETGISFAEIVSNVPNVRSKANSQFGTKAACLAPKRALGVMTGEVNRIYQLSARALIPLRFIVPRKSYRDFHADIFPLTCGVDSVLVPELWLAGKNAPVPRISLDPAVIKNDVSKCIRQPLSARKGEVAEKKKAFSKSAADAASKTKAKPSLTTKKPATKEEKPKPATKDDKLKPAAKDEKPKPTLKLDKPKVAGKETKPKAGGKEDKNKKITAPMDANANSETVALRDASHLSRNDEVRRSARELRDQFENRFASSSASQAEPVSENVFRKPLPRMKSVEENDAGKKPGDELKMAKSEVLMRNKNGALESASQVDGDENRGSFQRQTSTRQSRVVGRVAKFRHLKGTVPPRAQQYENLRDLNPALPTECDAIKGNEERFAITLRGPGGKVLVWDLANQGRLPDTIALLSFINSGTVMDFAWDPFNPARLAVATDDGTINLWDVVASAREGEGDDQHSRDQPRDRVRRPAGMTVEKITVIKWHPNAENILAVAHADGSVDIWDVTEGIGKIAFTFPDAGNGSGIWSMAWSPDGKQLAVLSRDGKLRLIDGRSGDVCQEGEGFNKGRGARVNWVLGSTMLLMSGFEAGSSRVVKLYDASDLKKGSLKTLEMDVSPSLVVPLYDEDSSTVFLYAKGDTTIHTYEVLSESPYLYPLSPHRSATPHHGLTLLPKRVVDVKVVEFARALRLTDSAIEPIIFTVPRVKSEYFQDDLFPPTQQTWLPSNDADGWVSGVDKEQVYISLKPDGMSCLTRNAAGDNAQVSYQRLNSNGSAKGVEVGPVSDKEKQKNVENSLSTMVTVNMNLEQDEMEGVDPQEWD